MELVNGTSLKGDNYKILSKISQGNFGITYMAEQTSLGRKVCIKEFFFRGSCERALSGHVTVTSSGQEVTNSFRRKFTREAKRLSQFDHPNIVKVIDIFEENGTAYMVMDFVEGETLQQLVDRKGKLSEKEALDYIIPLCNALEVVHEKGLLHLDIKPSNILIKKYTNTPVLIDFGVSKFTEASGLDHSTTTPVALTKGYAPLEQYGQDITKLTELTDVYAVAATLYKLVTGVTPPEASLIVQDGIKSPGELNPVLSDQLSSIILKSLSYKINDRAQSITKLKGDLLSISINSIVKAPVSPSSPVKSGSDEETEVIGGKVILDPKTPVKKPPVTPEPKGVNTLFFVLSLILVIVIAIMLFIKFNNDNPTSNANVETKNPAGQGPIYDIPVTDINGNVYKTVKIGTQIWMAENLKVRCYKNGDVIPYILDSTKWASITTGACCNYDNNSAFVSQYGKIYNWYAVSDYRNVAPEGWHVPSAFEWTRLIDYLGGVNVASDKLKEFSENSFCGLPGGFRSQGGSFYSMKYWGGWWCTSDANNSGAPFIGLDGSSNNIQRDNVPKKLGLYVRCVKD